jgi:glucose/arabinose dehydrogenase
MRNGDSMIVRYTVSEENPNRAEVSTARPIMQIEQPWANHNGGELAFGPDGYLYIGSGDGGWEGDPLGAGQDLSTLLGKILRIDVDVEGKRRYAIPEDNPFHQPLQRIQLFGVTEEEFARIRTEARPEIWAYGLRNPWKFQFDPATGDLYIAEVGQNHWEEVNFQPADSDGGENYGWDWLMGTHPHPIQKETAPQVGVPPIAEYSHEEAGICIIGLGVYRGERYPELDGIYFVGDWGSGKVFGIDRDDQGQWVMQELLDTGLLITGAGQAEDGTIYVTDAKASYGSRTAPSDNPPGSLWKLVAADQVPDDVETAPVDEDDDAAE